MWKVTPWNKWLRLVLTVALVAYPLDLTYAQLGLPGGDQAAPASSQVIQLAGPFFENAEIQDLAQELGLDVQRSFNFVRDSIGTEIYQGVLRGALSTLWSHAGNAADKALLLAALLEQAQVPHRFALGTLDDAAARQLVDAMFPPLPTEPQPEPVATSDIEQAILDQHRAFRQAVLEGTDAQFLPLAAALAAAGLSPAEPTLDQLIAEAKAHIWLQYQEGGRWVDLDPAFPDAKIGQTFTSPETITDALPSELSHQLTIQVRVEQRTDGELSDTFPLIFVTSTAGLGGTEILFTHQPSSPGLFSFFGGEMFNPVLFIGNQQIVGDPIDLNGGGGGLFGAFGGDSEVTGEWLEFIYTFPDGHTEITLREVFDRIGTAQRTAGNAASAELAELPEIDGTPAALAGVYSVVVAPGDVSPQALEQRVLAALNPTLEIINAGQADSPGDNTAAGEQFVSFLQMVNLSTVFAATKLAKEQAIAQGARTYQASARINVASAVIQEAEGARQLALQLDLRRVGYRTVGPEGGAGPAQLRRGALEAALERVLLEQLFGVPVTSASGTLARAQAQGVPLQVGTEENLSQLGLNEIATARIQAALAAGLAVLTPGGSVSPIAWWEVDPASGTAIAVDESGLHRAELAEYAGVLRAVAAPLITTYGSNMACAGTMNKNVCLGACIASLAALVVGLLTIAAATGAIASFAEETGGFAFGAGSAGLGFSCTMAAGL